MSYKVYKNNVKLEKLDKYKRRLEKLIFSHCFLKENSKEVDIKIDTIKDTNIAQGS